MTQAKFAETAVLEHVIGGDVAAAAEALSGFYDHELSEFARQVDQLADLIDAAREKA